MSRDLFGVVAGLVPAIHAFGWGAALKTWMPATSAGMTERGEGAAAAWVPACAGTNG